MQVAQPAPTDEKEKGIIRRIDEFFRFKDLRLHRTHDGILSRFGIDRHTMGVLILPALVSVWIVAASPAPNMRLLFAILFAGVVFFVTALNLRVLQRSRTVTADLFAQLVLVAAVCVFVWVAGQPTFQTEAFYRHIFVPAAAVLIMVLAIAASLAVYLFSDLLGNPAPYSEYLRNTELFANYGPDRATTVRSVVVSAVTAPFRGPLQLVLLPTIVTLVARRDLLRISFGISAAISVIAAIISGVDDRFSTMWRLLQGAFFRGGALLVSVLVILLGVLRIYGVSYIITVLDSAAASVVIFMLAGAYIFSWWFDYWSARLLSQQILILIGNERRASWIDYKNFVSAAATAVPDDGRLLQIHGSSRFLAIRPPDPEGQKAPAPAPDPPPRRVPENPKLRSENLFQAYTIGELITLLASSGAPGGKACPLPSQIMARVGSYYALLALAMILLAGAGLTWLRSSGALAELQTKTTQPSNLALTTLLFDEKNIAERHPVIALAASGGGTRAALYTASVLLGLSRKDAADRVVVASGVSGGGAALAYFAGNRPALLDADDAKRKHAWDLFFAKMKEPFIEDVLEQASEWRILRGGRLGLLLAQSFRARWELPENRRTMGAVQDFGLMLNTSVAGHFDRQNGMDGPLMDMERRHRDQDSSTLAGGRLVLTNLTLGSDLVGEPLEGPGAHKLPIIVDDRETRLETAAALNANFPPVFSDAAVDIDEQTRYWVTDGGAIDNRGMETLLYAIRQALWHRPNPGAKLPVLRVVVADASGYSPLFSQDRGTGALGAAGTNLASQVALELHNEIQAIYDGAKQHDDFKLDYLYMPDALRISGSFGTHWMLQPEISIEHQGEKVKLTGDETLQVVRCLYIDGCALGADSAKVLAWARESTAKWREIAGDIALNPKETR
jgi:hypothetical protein